MAKQNAIQAVIFDLDGTLVDSAEDLRAALNQLLSELGLRSIEAAEVHGMIGDGVLKLVERGLSAAGANSTQAEVVLPRFLEIYQADPAKLTRPYAGVVETLSALKRARIRMAVVTNKPFTAAMQILQALSLADYFLAVVGGDSLPYRKPRPEPMLEAIRQLRVGLGQSIVVGDNIHDVEAAHAAGMRCIAVSYGYHHLPPSEFDADHLVDRFEQIVPLVLEPLRNSEHSSGVQISSATHSSQTVK
jgi:phosphoglycolate phosphatase